MQMRSSDIFRPSPEILPCDRTDNKKTAVGQTAVFLLSIKAKWSFSELPIMMEKIELDFEQNTDNNIL